MDAGPQKDGRYRPEIEGLRAVAILLVVAAHAGVPGFEGGFVGVDIFFVLSGYLITGLLVQEQEKSGRIDFGSFYARRFRRLLPALLLMLLGTAIAAWVVLPMDAQHEQAVAGAAASLWVSNLYFAFQELDYFGAAAESNIYLHTWSLSVEEQFYLVWPLLIEFLMRRRSTVASVGWLVPGLMVLLVFSLAASIWITDWSARYAFYLMPTRGWQFASGAILFLGARQYASVIEKDESRGVLQAVGLVGVALIGIVVLLVDADSAYPGAWAILPTLGTACLILAGRARVCSTWLLSLPLMQAIGRVSYAWYLWHWPVLILGATLLPLDSVANRGILVAVALLIATITFILVEKPIRSNVEALRKPGSLIVASLALMTVTMYWLFQWGGAAEVESIRLSAVEPEKQLRVEVPTIYQMGCDDWYHSDRLVPCVFGSRDAKMTVVVVGDSIGVQWFPAFEKIFTSPNWKLIVLTKSSCPMVDRAIFYARIGREYTECAVWRQRALAYIKDIRPRLVIMGSTHTAAYTEDEWTSGTGDVLSQIAPSSGEIAIMRSTPILPFSGADCLSSNRRLHRALSSESACVASAYDAKAENVATWLRRAASAWTNVDFVDVNDLVCPQGVCSAGEGGKLIFRDMRHLNAGFVAGLASPLAARLGVPYPPRPNL